MPARWWKLVAAVVGAFVVGGFVLILDYKDHYILEPAPFLTMAVVFAILCIATIVLLQRKLRWKGGSLQGLVAGIAFLFVMTFGIVMLGYVPAINAHFDDSPPTTHRLQVHSFRDGKTKYAIVTWRGSDEFALAISKSLYTARPSHVVVTTREGFLGLEWRTAARAD